MRGRNFSGASDFGEIDGEIEKPVELRHEMLREARRRNERPHFQPFQHQSMRAD